MKHGRGTVIHAFSKIHTAENTFFCKCKKTFICFIRSNLNIGTKYGEGHFIHMT